MWPWKRISFSECTNLDMHNISLNEKMCNVFWWHFYFKVYLLWEKERARAQEHTRERQRERERENPKQAPWCQYRAWRRAWTHKPRDHDLSWDQDLDAQLTEPPRHPLFYFLMAFMLKIWCVYLYFVLRKNSKYKMCKNKTTKIKK